MNKESRILSLFILHPSSFRGGDMARARQERDLVGQLVRHFEQAILSGQLAPGDLLPPERAISEQMDVSRTVVREALGRLASTGLVRSVHGSGTRVEAPTARPLADGYQRLVRQGQ